MLRAAVMVVLSTDTTGRFSRKSRSPSVRSAECSIPQRNTEYWSASTGPQSRTPLSALRPAKPGCATRPSPWCMSLPRWLSAGPSLNYRDASPSGRRKTHGTSSSRHRRRCTPASVSRSHPRCAPRCCTRHIVPALVDASKEAQMVVLGSRGMGALGRLLLGSGSSGLVHHAHCPVAIVHSDEARAPDSTSPVLLGHRRVARLAGRYRSGVRRSITPRGGPGGVARVERCRCLPDPRRGLAAVRRRGTRSAGRTPRGLARAVSRRDRAAEDRV